VFVEVTTNMKQEFWNRHRYDNAVQVIEALWNESPLSRAEIGRRVHLDRSTVGTIIDYLSEIGLVVETSEILEQQVGRPARALKLKAEYGYALGISYTPDLVETIAVDTGGNIFKCYNEAHTSADLHNNLLKTIDATISQIETNANPDITNEARLLSVGIAVPGVVDTNKGDLLVSRSLGIQKPVTLGTDLSNHYSVPVSVFNDADAGALGEYDSQIGIDDLLYVLVRYSEHPFRANAGLGIILDHRLREAHSGLGREFRSPYVSPESTEQFRVSEDVLKHHLQNVEEIRIQFADELGASLAFLIHALDLRNIVLAGDLQEGLLDRTDVEERILHYVRTSTVQVSNQPLRLVSPNIREKSIHYGAAVGSIRSMFHKKTFPVGPKISRRLILSSNEKINLSIP
jgi:predicted NBD/HSP70 family sugar kinase